MPEGIDLPDWVSETSRAPSRREGAPPTRRSERRRATEPQSRSATRRDGRTAHIDPHTAAATRAERRRAAQPSGRRAEPSRATRPVEMVQPESSAEARRRSQRYENAPGRRRASTSTLARRRLLATLVVTTVLALVLWAVWPSAESSGPGRETADLTTAAVTRSGADPIPAAEDLPPDPTTSPSPGASTVPTSGSGRLVGVALPAIAAPTVNPSRTVRVGLQVERGAGVNADEVATLVSSTLGDARGWQTRDRVRFRAVSPAATARGEVDITIVLASPTLTDSLCKPLETKGQVSCFNLRKVVLNAGRWAAGATGYEKDLTAYRQYMVNHEVGHGLYHGHVECPGRNALAPVMLQQTKGLDGCRPNAWPTLP
ncbi:hypothetical protein GCM10022415_01180 [Knoellia locipacati]|uniref:DUF3152 domain-containing protein n=1 Tax=Knoellia locipacati TaxID=882824 RepID=A0A512SVU8_9MICO|nr:DUF3152 domain-containing protein [Knoellia locipacati]GEQ12071.1 hypothetical protein KLO01_01180 [Knoellia locipacati]